MESVDKYSANILLWPAQRRKQKLVLNACLYLPGLSVFNSWIKELSSSTLLAWLDRLPTDIISDKYLNEKHKSCQPRSHFITVIIMTCAPLAVSWQKCQRMFIYTGTTTAPSLFFESPISCQARGHATLTRVCKDLCAFTVPTISSKPRTLLNNMIYFIDNVSLLLAQRNNLECLGSVSTGIGSWSQLTYNTTHWIQKH